MKVDVPLMFHKSKFVAQRNRQISAQTRGNKVRGNVADIYATIRVAFPLTAGRLLPASFPFGHFDVRHVVLPRKTG